MNSLLRCFSLVFLIAMLALPVSATTVYPAERECPACQHTFITTGISSYYNRGGASDLSGSMYAVFGRVVACPYCLYAATDFGELTAKERERVRQILAELPRHLANFPSELKTRALAQHYSSVEFLKLGIAEVCDTARTPDPGRTAHLRYAIYLQSKYIDDAPVHIAERQRTIEFLEAGLTKDVFTPKEKPMFRYLAGELRRRSGDTNAAMAHFDLVENDGEFQRRASEQKILARDGERPSKKSIADEEKLALRARLVRALPNLIAAIQAGKPANDWLLPDEDKSETIGAALELLEAGNRDAAVFLVHWLGRLESSELSSRDYKICRILRVLGRNPALLPTNDVQKISFRVSELKQIAHYAVVGGEFPASIRGGLERRERLSVLDQAAIAAADGRRDDSIKSLLLNRLKQSSGIDDEVKTYFASVGTAADLPVLETSATRIYPGNEKRGREGHGYGFARQYIEESIWKIRVRTMLARKE